MLRLRISLPKEANVSTFFAQLSAPIFDCQWSNVGRVTIDMLPEIALLDIFDFYGHEIDAWHTLVHVCRKWRIIVFGSPRRLDLRLLCTASTPVSEGVAGHLATVTHRRKCQWSRSPRVMVRGLHGQRHCGTGAQRSHM